MSRHQLLKGVGGYDPEPLELPVPHSSSLPCRGDCDAIVGTGMNMQYRNTLQARRHFRLVAGDPGMLPFLDSLLHLPLTEFRKRAS
jgi:hypothetical protein